jgi:hypothetical protein
MTVSAPTAPAMTVSAPTAPAMTVSAPTAWREFESSPYNDPDEIFWKVLQKEATDDARVPFDESDPKLQALRETAYVANQIANGKTIDVGRLKICELPTNLVTDSIQEHCSKQRNAKVLNKDEVDFVYFSSYSIYAIKTLENLRDSINWDNPTTQDLQEVVRWYVTAALDYWPHRDSTYRWVTSTRNPKLNAFRDILWNPILKNHPTIDFSKVLHDPESFFAKYLSSFLGDSSERMDSGHLQRAMQAITTPSSTMGLGDLTSWEPSSSDEVQVLKWLQTNASDVSIIIAPTKTRYLTIRSKKASDAFNTITKHFIEKCVIGIHMVWWRQFMN